MTTNGPEFRRYQRALLQVSTVVDGVPENKWGCPSPCPGWTARDVLAHLIDAQLQVISMITGRGPRVPASDPTVAAGDDVAETWHATVTQLINTLEEHDTGTSVATPVGTSTVAHLMATAIIEPLLHGWDLAIATGQQIELDPDAVHHTLLGIQSLGSQLAASGMYAPARDCGPEATEQDQLLAATGRDPRTSQPPMRRSTRD